MLIGFIPMLVFTLTITRLKIKKGNNIRDSFNEKSRQNKKLINNLQLYYVLSSYIQF